MQAYVAYNNYVMSFHPPMPAIRNRRSIQALVPVDVPKCAAIH